MLGALLPAVPDLNTLLARRGCDNAACSGAFIRVGGFDRPPIPPPPPLRPDEFDIIVYFVFFKNQ
jgi:hypothetical protein